MSKLHFALLSLTVLTGIVLSYITGIPLTVGFIPGILVAMWFVRGIGWPGIKDAMLQGVLKTKDVIFILGMVGLLLPSWTASGVINYLITAGLSVIDPRYFLLSAFWLTAIVSFILGTSSGSLSTIGLALAGAGSILGIPAPIVAGALVSGAFVGDRTSLLSSANRLVAASAGLSMSDQMRSLLPTTLAGLAAASAFYLFIDLTGEWGAGQLGQHTAIAQPYAISPLLLLAPAILVTGIILRLPSKPVFLAAIGIAIVLGSVLQSIPFVQWPSYLWRGVQGQPPISSKGFIHMLPLISFIGLTGAFNGLLDKSKILEPYLCAALSKKPSLAWDSNRLITLGLCLNLLLCNQTLPIMISAGTLAGVWTARHPRTDLARVVSDSSLVFAGLVPWNMLALLCGSILSISPIEYLPYAIFLWSLPLITLGVSLWRDKV